MQNEKIKGSNETVLKVKILIGIALFWVGVASSVIGVSSAFGQVGAIEKNNKNSDLGSLENWCHALQTQVSRFNWPLQPCRDIEWKILGHSVQGRPLVYAALGDEKAPNVTLVMSMVHGDEVTPLYLGLEIAHWYLGHRAELANTRVIIAPLVNPDSFYRDPRTRVNANGVDVNRNFHTRDWDLKALKMWAKKFKKNPRRFPGKSANSEPETLFQIELIQQFKPQKILSIHAPLNFLDYDGPSSLTLARFSKDYVRECLKLRSYVKAVSGGFFPGSLGNFAGQEMGIPTLTLELPTADSRRASQYWEKFRTGIHQMIEFKMPPAKAVIKP